MLGAQMTLTDGAHVILLAMDRGGYANLCRLITRDGCVMPRAPAA